MTTEEKEQQEEETRPTRRTLTLDANIFVGSAKPNEPYRKRCLELVRLIPDIFLLSEPSIIYEEVCGTIARRVGADEAKEFADKLDRLVSKELLFACDRAFCLSTYPLCSEYGIYSVDALYLNAAINSEAILVSLDDKDFVSKIKGKNHHNIEAYHPSDFPYFSARGLRLT